MHQIKDIIIHVSVEVAGRTRKCHHSRGKHSISKGEPCLVIKGGSYNAARNYCRECAEPILKKAELRLAEICSRIKGIKGVGDKQ